MGIPAFEDDDTTPAPCGCSACLDRLRVSELLARAGITKKTTIHEPRSGRFTVYLVQEEQLRAGGDGETEEEAFDRALHVLSTMAVRA